MAALDPNKPELDFVERTRKQVEAYRGANEFTNLLNCMLGLIIVPRERHPMLEKIPDDPLSSIMWDGNPAIFLLSNTLFSKQIRVHPRLFPVVVSVLRDSVALW